MKEKKAIQKDKQNPQPKGFITLKPVLINKFVGTLRMCSQIIGKKIAPNRIVIV